MSYCRFSSDYFRSDVYCYESESGICVHMANNRVVDWSGAPPPVALAGPVSRELIAAFMDCHNKTSAWLTTKPEREVINHPEAGAGHVFSSYLDAADFIEQMSADGFHVPEGVVDELRIEAREAVDSTLYPTGDGCGEESRTEGNNNDQAI